MSEFISGISSKKRRFPEAPLFFTTENEPP